MNPQAAELNSILETEGPAALRLLSEKGKNIFFPRKGLVAQGLDARGKTINASIGEAKEDDGTPLRLSPLADRIKLAPADAFSYAPSFGKPALRDRWAEMIREKNPSLGDTPFSRPVTTNALTHGLAVAGYMFIDDGDEIILPRHYWGNYRLIFSEAYGGVMKTFETFNGEGPDAGFNVEALSESLMSPGEKKILLLNFPNNPTGYTPTEAEFEAIVNAVEKAAEAGKTILAITDDAYFGLVFREGIAGESPFSRFASLHENVVACKVDGATKEDYVWGFRVGFISFAGKGLNGKALAALEDKAAGRVRGSISNDSHLAQSLLLAAYDDPSYGEEKKRAFNLLKKRHDALVAELESHPEYRERFAALPFNSGYFMCVKVAGGDGEAVRQKLLKDYDTGVIALGDLVRVAYSSLPEAQIPQLFANLHAACGEIQTGA
jgi:aspartate/methionine/tyrosine aminotransferase